MQNPSMTDHYNPKLSEANAQQFWQDQQTFTTDLNSNKPHFYCLSMFPYPSGQLHMGHVRNYTLSDVIARQKRMQGHEVLHPIGWDAFGLPAENAAIKHQVAPAKWTNQNIAHMKQQFQQLGLGFDWSKELATCNPDYYRWEQWLFIQLYKKGLVYRKNAVVNWDPVDQTVLANEQVVDGRGWRSGALVEKKDIAQWFIKITDYADQLLADLDQLDGWPERVRTMQKNWIGRSQGVEIQFQLKNSEQKLSIYTTRADTLMGVTYVAMAAEHPLCQHAAKNRPELQAFIEQCRHSSTMEADLATIDKQGIDTGLTAIHPLTGKEIPIWAANFVLMDYGSGAVMSVPTHDQRDFEFAEKYHLPIRQVIDNAQVDYDLKQAAMTDSGQLINSEQFNGLDSEQAKAVITDFIEQHNLGQRQTHYRLRDWGVSRQRYWGTPIPMIHCADCGVVPVAEDQLPVVLPEEMVPQGNTSPLKTDASFYQTTCPACGKPAQRDTDTLDTFVESSWYYARYTSTDNQNNMLSPVAKQWLPVNQYIGGIEHAVMHLLYARFFHKLMRDMGFIDSDEPFKNLLTQGMVLKDGSKMSKSKGNTVDPQTLIDQYGADTVRLFSMFAAPPEQSLEWADSGVDGAYRFLRKLWQLAQQAISDDKPANDDNRHRLHQIIQQACHDMDKQQFNTVVSAGMKIVNLLSKVDNNPALTGEGLNLLLRLLHPIVPHITHELWVRLGFGDDIAHAAWPQANPEALKAQTMIIMVQINGKVRSKLILDANADQAQVELAAKADESVNKYMADKTLRKLIYVPGRLVNMVVS